MVSSSATIGCAPLRFFAESLRKRVVHPLLITPT